MEPTRRYGLVACGIGLGGVVFLLYRGTPLLSLQNVSRFSYYPAALAYVFFLVVFAGGLVLVRLQREATRGTVSGRTDGEQ